jgi:c-di-GMP-binding flagellar brake protein YcgR
MKLELREKLHLQMEREGKKFTFLSRILEHNSTAVIIEYPTALEGGGVLLVGDRVEATITRSDAIWGFSSKVIEKIAGQQPLMKLAPPLSIERNQRRRYVRVDWLTACRWRPFLTPKADDPEAEVIGEEADGTILNISAGGILMAANDPPKNGDYLVVKPLNVNWPLAGAIAGKVMWHCSQPPESRFHMHIGVDFRDLEEVAGGWTKEHREKLPGNIVMLSQATRHRLMQFIYQRQIELRNKGLL